MGIGVGVLFGEVREGGCMGWKMAGEGESVDRYREQRTGLYWADVT